MSRVFVDMDGVIADYKAGARAYAETHGLGPDVCLKHIPGMYASLPVVQGAKKALTLIATMGFDVWIATKPPTGCARAYQEKAEWLFQNFPELTRKLIITPDKGLLGDEGDFLIDDRPHKANCQEFKGQLIVFQENTGWLEALELLVGKRTLKGENSGYEK